MGNSTEEGRIVALPFLGCWGPLYSSLVVLARMSINPYLGNDVIYLKQRTNDALGCQAATAAKTRGFGNSLAERRWDTLHG